MKREHLSQRERKLALIIARRALTDPKAACAGAMPEIFCARSTASMATFNVERVPPWVFVRSTFVAIAGAWSGRRKTQVQAERKDGINIGSLFPS